MPDSPGSRLCSSTGRRHKDGHERLPQDRQLRKRQEPSRALRRRRGHGRWSCPSRDRRRPRRFAARLGGSGGGGEPVSGGRGTPAKPAAPGNPATPPPPPHPGPETNPPPSPPSSPPSRPSSPPQTPPP